MTVSKRYRIKMRKLESQVRRWHRRALFLFQNGRCYLCGETLNPRSPKTTFDHVDPDNRKLEGNALLACGPCNQLKADRAPYACELMFLSVCNDAVGMK